MFITRCTRSFLRLLPLLLFISILGAAAQPLTAEAETTELSNPELTSLDAAYSTLQGMELALTTTDAAIQAVCKANNLKLKSVREKLKLVGSSEVRQLEAELKAAQSRHAPLLARSKSLSERLKAANSRKDKKAADLLRLQINRLKPSVKQAQADIKSRQAALRTAKKAAAAEVKRIKAVLDEISPLKKKVQTAQADISSLKKGRSAAWKSFHAAVKQGSAAQALLALTSAAAKLREASAQQQHILSWERQSSTIIERAYSMLKS
ncbi:hypothetical protein DCC85_01740 [Paenibacillus sp. CAA11]|uniref:hypothetical protein n=1 Tax=Paenibacillus sp. CAA11 TaxID=1532905 RepID=UPI000D335C7B|nr:hypothetical protein [Paenibacillus sp. CAA11]AWB43077.1 hypothetical protein DCC85_01740 [Paenibacillus sp. CAA11]